MVYSADTSSDWLIASHIIGLILSTTSPPPSLYKHITCSLHYEQYLEYVVGKPLKSAITKLRISAHNLRIEVGSYSVYSVNRVQRCDRVYQLCETGDIEDEYHVVCCCPVLVNERQSSPKHVHTKPNMFKFTDGLCNLSAIKANNSQIYNRCEQTKMY
jgi:hypothetical protein